MKILAAMSGGVDSSVAAALLKKNGYEVIGVTLRLSGCDDTAGAAGIVARRLAIPHHVLDFRELFEREIIGDFCREYGRGRTPNPCVRCNRYIKFGALLDMAAELGAGVIATGHYARIEREGNKPLLKKGVDTTKDQSYFLCKLTAGQLEHAMFPVGSLTKAQVREMAKEMRLPVAERPESQEICFIPDNNHAAFLAGRLPESALPGPILDERGKVLGKHRGIASYTVGQRQGLGIAAAAPLYVTAIEPERNAVIVGSKEMVYGRGLVAEDLNWTGIEPPQAPIKVKAKIRYRHPEAAAGLTPLDGGDVYVKFDEPQMAITPGQTVAFYEGDTIIGGGTIKIQER